MRRNWKKGETKKRKKSGSSASPKKKSDAKKEEDFEAIIKSKTDDFEKEEEKKKKALKKSIRDCKEEWQKLDAVEGRHVIRKKRILENKISTSEKMLEELVKGVAKLEFERKINDFRREKRRIMEKAPTNAKKSVRKRAKSDKKKLSDTNRRKTAGHNRNIKISSSNTSEDTGLDVLIQEIQDEFGEESEDRAVYVALNHVCPRCNINMQKISSESVLSCPTCGIMTPYIDSTAASTSHSDERSFSHFAYSRSGHFSNWLRTIQGKESASIPPEILQGVCIELAKKRISAHDVTPPKIRDALKQMKQRKYYENSVLICSLLTGRKPPRFSPEVERTLENLFLKIQDPFARAKECLCPERKNFLSYPYVCLKLLQLLDSNSVDKQWLQPTRLPRLKGRDKLAKSDKIWKHICLQLNWRFIPSA